MSPSIRVRVAFVWECPACQTENYHNGRTVRDLTFEEREEIGIPEGEPAISMPPHVTCRTCFAEYDVGGEDYE